MDPSKQGPPPGYDQPAPYPQSQPGQPVATPAGGYPPGQPGYGGQPAQTVIVTQPVATTAIVAAPRPPDYMIPSILVCLFCFWPTGLAAIYYSSRANSMVAEGNMPEAHRYSKTAKYLLIATVVIGVIWIVIVIAVRVAAASAVAASHKY